MTLDLTSNAPLIFEEPAPERSRILLLVAYDGSDFAGFQQQSGVPTIAGELDRAIAIVDPRAGKVTGSSRTDAGVHAKLQPVSFTTYRTIRSRGWVHALMPHLPKTIAVLRASRVAMEFDPRKRPLWKRYRYRILNSPIEDPFLRARAWRIRESLDLQAMQEEALALVGEHDFAAFRSAKDPRTTTIRNLRTVRVERAQDHPACIDIVVEGDRFMYNMVRIIAGTLVDVGRGKHPVGISARAISTGERVGLGMTAPPDGLCLDHVELDDWGVDPWPTRAEGGPV